jgi:hypothetical protein
MHVLRQTSVKKHPRLAVPAGVESVAKAIYLFGDDPQFGADPNMRILANAQKFNFGAEPASLQFEYSTAPVSVRNPRTRKRRLRDFGFWIDRGETQVTAKMLLVKLAPDKKESKSDRVVMELVELLREGPMSTRDLKEHFLGLMPPITWRTVERVKRDMEIEEADDPADGRSKLWSLYGLTLEDVEDADSLDDLVVEEIDAPDIPDVIPEDWMDEEGAA